MSEYFVKQSYGVIWHFCSNKQGICFCNMINNRLNSYEILVPGGQGDFDLLIDNENGIHIICQNNIGEILYLKNTDKEWKKYVVLKSKNQTSYDKGFKIVQSGNDINIFYTIDYKGKKMLARQILTKASVPSIIDTCKDGFEITVDKNENIYLLYVNDNKNQLGVRKILKNNEVLSFDEIKTSKNLLNYDIVVLDGKIHIVGCDVENNLLYIKEGVEKIIDQNAKQPVFVINNKLNIMWENLKNGKVMMSTEGEDLKEFMADRNISAKIFLICSSGSISSKCYGYINNNMAYLYLYKDFFEIPRIAPKNEREEVNSLKRRITNLENEVKQLKSRIVNVK